LKDKPIIGKLIADDGLICVIPPKQLIVSTY